MTQLNRAAGSSYDQGFKDLTSGALALPQKVTFMTPIATAKAASFTDWDKPHTITSLAQFYSLFGVCPGYYAARIFKPINGGGIGTAPLIVYPVEDLAGAAAAAGSITPTGTADANGTHTIIFKGRKSIDGRKASFAVTKDDTPAVIVDSMVAAIQGLLSAPVSAADDTTKADITAKWKGTTGNEISLSIDDGGEDCGVSYAIVNPTSGSTSPVISTSLDDFGGDWKTMLCNIGGSADFDALEAKNGMPDIDTGGSGLWQGTTMKPFVAVTGSVSAVPATLKALMSARKNDLTNSVFTAPNCPNYTWEVAANVITVAIGVWNKSPHLGIKGRSLPDLSDPTGGTIGTMVDYAVRDDLVSNGCSTCTYNESDGYVIEDFVTFRRPDDQNPLAIDFSYVRDVVGVDFNVAYNYKFREERDLTGKTIANDDDSINVTGVIKPKDWKAECFDLIDDLVTAALVTDSAYTKESLTVLLSGTDPQRINTVFPYKRSGIARKTATKAYAGFNFGEV